MHFPASLTRFVERAALVLKKHRIKQTIDAKQLWYERLVTYFPDMKDMVTPSEVIPCDDDTEMTGPSVMIHTSNGTTYLFIFNKIKNIAQLVRSID